MNLLKGKVLRIDLTKGSATLSDQRSWSAAGRVPDLLLNSQTFLWSWGEAGSPGSFV